MPLLNLPKTTTTLQRLFDLADPEPMFGEDLVRVFRLPDDPSHSHGKTLYRTAPNAIRIMSSASYAERPSDQARKQRAEFIPPPHYILGSAALHISLFLPNQNGPRQIALASTTSADLRDLKGG